MKCKLDPERPLSGDHRWNGGTSAGRRCLRCGMAYEYELESLKTSAGVLAAVVTTGFKITSHGDPDRQERI